jgi:hypothetical protein
MEELLCPMSHHRLDGGQYLRRVSAGEVHVVEIVENDAQRLVEEALRVGLVLRDKQEKTADHGLNDVCVCFKRHDGLVKGAGDSGRFRHGSLRFRSMRRV